MGINRSDKGYFSITCGRIRNGKQSSYKYSPIQSVSPELSHSDFYVFLPASVSLISVHKGPCLRQEHSSFSLVLSTLPIGHYILGLDGKSIYDIWVIIFWPEAVADDTEVVPLENRTVIWCLPGLPGGGWMRHTHKAPSVSAQWEHKLLLRWWSGLFLMMSQTRRSQRCHRIGIRSCVWSFQVSKHPLHTVLQQKFSSLKLLAA